MKKLFAILFLCLALAIPSPSYSGTRALQIDVLLSGLRDPDTLAPLAGGTVYFYAAGTTTPKNVWSEKAKTNAYTSVTLDANGSLANPYYGDGWYKLVVKDSDGNTEYTWDQVFIQANTYSVRSISSESTATPEDDVIICDGTFTLNLADVGTFEHSLTVIPTDGSSITINPYSTQTIAGDLTLTVTKPVLLVPDTGAGLWRTDFTAITADDIPFTPAGAGAVGRTVQEKLRDIVNAKDFGATGDGVTNDRAAVAAADAVVTEAIHFSAGTYLISTSLTIASAVVMEPGAKFSIPTGQTLTINGKFKGCLSQHFALTGTAAIVFGTNAVDGVRPEWFGAVGNASTDDSTAVQATVNTCLSTVSRPFPMLCSGRYKIATMVNIDRQVGSTPDYIGSGAFRIIGEGRVAGFYATTAINMFGSTLTDNATPQSEAIDFENIQFEVDANTTAAYVLDGEAFLRVHFNGCRFAYIKCLTSTVYVQSIHFNKCVMREWIGVFFNHPDDAGYDIVFEGNIIESGEDLWKGSGMSGVRFTNNLCEYLSDQVIEFDISNGVFISGNYFEQNAGSTNAPYIETGVPYGVVILGNHFMLTAAQVASGTFFAVNWWDSGTTGSYSARAFSAGNYCNGKLHDKSDLMTYGDDNGWVSLGDYSSDAAFISRLPFGLGVMGQLSANMTEFADNAAAVAGGLVEDDLYHTSGAVKKVVP